MKQEIEKIELLEDTADLYISGTLPSNRSQLKVLLDQQVLLEENPNLSDCRFSFMFACPKEGKKLMVYCIEKKKETLLYQTSLASLQRKRNRTRKCSYIKRNIQFLWREYHFFIPPKKLKEYASLFIKRIILNRSKEERFYQLFSIEDYNDWLRENPQSSSYQKFSYMPFISIIMPVYNVDAKYLKEAIESVMLQTYPNFELCIADDASTNQETIQLLKEMEKKYDKVHVVYRKKNGHISKASNSALKIARGEFIGLMDNDDILDKNALYEVVKALNKNKNLDLIYTDEDKIDPFGRRCDPHFKPDWSPDTLLSHNYICHFALLRASLVKQIGNFRKGYEGAQDYDLMLRFTEQTQNIYHIPKILYHWRMIEGSTSMTTDNKSYASMSGIKALEDALKRRKIKASIANIATSYILKYEMKNNPKVSIIIPTKDKIGLVETCVNSIYQKTKYQNYEVIIIDNNSQEAHTMEGLRKLQEEHDNLKVMEYPEKFNYSKINNIGAKHAEGDYLLLLNNDVEVIDGEWLEIMLGYAMQERIGAVGAKLLFANGKIQHAGVVVGVGEEKIANHAYYLKDKFASALAGRLLVPYNYAAVTGACLMVDKKKYFEVNGLTEELEINYNDIDFCLKLLEKGYYNICLPQVELYHYESLSRGKSQSPEKAKELQYSTEYMKKKWKKILQNDPFYNPNLSKEMCFVLDKKEVEKNEKE